MLARGETRPDLMAPSREHEARRVDVRLGNQRLGQLLADYEAGTETEELQRRYGLSKGSVRKLLADAGVAPHRRPLSDEEIQACCRLYAGGMTIREVGIKLNIPKTTVQNALQRAGISLRPAQRRRRLR